MNLFDWQLPILAEMEEKLNKSRRLMLTCGTGIGKTYLLSALSAQESRPAFVICPKSIKSSWRKVLDGFDAGWYDVVNWEQLKTGKTVWWDKERGLWHLPKDVTVIMDEAHKQCSGQDSQAGRMMAKLHQLDLDLVLCSATMASSPLQMRHSGYVMGLHSWETIAWRRWLQAHGCYYDKWARHWWGPSGKRATEIMAEIHKSLESRIVHRKHTDIPGFPECDTQAKLYDLDERDRREMEKAYAEMSERMRRTGRSDIAELGKSRERVEFLKCTLIAELVQDALAEDLSVVVFLNYREPLHKLKALLAEAKIKACLIEGGQSEAERNKAIDDFQENRIHVALVMSQAGGVGISLHDVKQERPRIAYINPSFSASDTRQCLGRIWRAGGTKAIQRFVLAAGTVEEQVYRAITAKLKNIDTLNDGDLQV